MWEVHSGQWEHHGVRTTYGVWTSTNTLDLVVWNNTVLGEAEETREIGRREELAVEGLTHQAKEFEFHSVGDKEPSKRGREGKFNRE